MLSERIVLHLANDHKRGCDGRCYTCSCGYDEAADALMNEAIRINTALIAALERWDDMITNCVGVPQNPDSLPMMLRHEIRAALTAAQGASADTGETSRG